MISAAFLLAVLAMLMAVRSSRDHVLQKVGIVLLGAWVGTNLAVSYFGFANAPIVIPMIHFICGAAVATSSYKRRTFAFELILLLYGLMVVFDLVSFPLRIEGTWTYYAVDNVIFGVQLLVAGATGAWMAIRNRPPARSQRSSPYGARSAAMDDR
jgi:uncharacterized membrane protein